MELRCRSAFSFLEGASNPEDLVDRAAELGHGTLALADRDGLYGGPDGDYEDNAERFVHFCRAALEALSRLRINPDVIHCHDWQTGPVPLLLVDPRWEGSLADGRLADVIPTLLAHAGLSPSSQMTGRDLRAG